MLPAFFKNPYNIAAAIMLVAATCLFAQTAFSAEDWKNQLRFPIGKFELSPTTTCFGHEDGSDIEHNVDLILRNDRTMDVVEDIRPYEGYDGFVQYILNEEDGSQILKEWRWKVADKLLCERDVQVLPKPNNT